MNRKYSIVITVVLLLILSGCNAKDAEDKNVYTGTIEANQYTISSELSGKIQEIITNQGDVVKEGATLIKIDTELYNLQKKQAMGALDIMKAKEDALPNSANEHLEKEARGAVKQAQATVDLAQLQIDKGNIKTIIDGTISEIFVKKGEYVAPGTRVIEITDFTKLYVKIYVEESKRNNIKVDDELRMTLNDTELVGRVIYISPKSEFTPKNVETKDEKAKTYFEVKLQLPENSTESIGSMVDVILE